MEKTPIIEVQHITKRFKGLTAVKDVSFSIREGAITGMIGPNGAGKSTTFNMICGYYPPTEGKIFFRGEDITNKKAYDYTNMKIARTFQIMKPLKNLSVLENVVASCYFGHAAAKNQREARERAMDILQFTDCLRSAMFFPRIWAHRTRNVWKWRGPWQRNRSFCSWMRIWQG